MKNTHFSTGMRKLKRLAASPGPWAHLPHRGCGGTRQTLSVFPTGAACTSWQPHHLTIRLIDLEEIFILLLLQNFTNSCAFSLSFTFTVWWKTEIVFCLKLYLWTCPLQLSHCQGSIVTPGCFWFRENCLAHVHICPFEEVMTPLDCRTVQYFCHQLHTQFKHLIIFTSQNISKKQTSFTLGAFSARKSGTSSLILNVHVESTLHTVL